MFKYKYFLWKKFAKKYTQVVKPPYIHNMQLKYHPKRNQSVNLASFLKKILNLMAVFTPVNYFSENFHMKTF